jgi:hypothetical protein
MASTLVSIHRRNDNPRLVLLLDGACTHECLHAARPEIDLAAPRIDRHIKPVQLQLVCARTVDVCLKKHSSALLGD